MTFERASEGLGLLDVEGRAIWRCSTISYIWRLALLKRNFPQAVSALVLAQMNARMAAIHMHRHDGDGARGDGGFDAVGVEIEGVWVDVDDWSVSTATANHQLTPWPNCKPMRR